MHVVTGRAEDGLLTFRSLRGTNNVENYHKRLKDVVFSCRVTPRLAHSVLVAFNADWNVRMAGGPTTCKLPVLDCCIIIQFRSRSLPLLIVAKYFPSGVLFSRLAIVTFVGNEKSLRYRLASASLAARHLGLDPELQGFWSHWIIEDLQELTEGW